MLVVAAVVAGWLPAARLCTSGTDLLRQFYVLPPEIEDADQTFYLTQSQYLAILGADSIPPGAWQGSHWSANFQVAGMTRLGKILASGNRTPDLLLSRPPRWPSG